MKKVTNSTTSQVNAWPPPTAIAPMVSATTMAEMRKKIVSSRPSTRKLPAPRQRHPEPS